MVSITESADLAPVAELVNELHDGNLLSLTKWLDRAIYMFHFLPEEENFSEHERCNVMYALHCLKERLMEAYFRQQGWQFVPMD